jgi:hypothetical protein
VALAQLLIEPHVSSVQRIIGAHLPIQEEAMGMGPGVAKRKRSRAVRRTAEAESPTNTADELEAQNRRLDEALIETFPASDPIAVRIEPNTPARHQRSRKVRAKE